MPGSPANAIFHPLSGGRHPLGKSRIVIPAPSADGGLGDEVAWYCPTLDDSPNDISASGGNDGTYQGGMATVADTEQGGTRAYEFDGTDDLVNCGDVQYFDDLTSFSISLWAKPSTISGLPGLFSKWDTNRGPIIFLNAGAVAWQVGTGGNRLTTGLVTANVWTHLVCLSDSGTLRVYLNGVLQSGTVAQGANGAHVQPQIFCTDTTGGIGRLDGLMDDIRIFNRTLIPAEITHLASARGVLGPAT